jgi:hypothetical protein
MREETHAPRREPTRHDFSVDVGGLAGATIAGRCFAPDPTRAGRLPIPLWIFAIPGSSADWRYFDLEFPGHEDEGYSWAAYLSARGVGLVAIDNLGIGDSNFPADGSLLSLELLADANHQAVTQVRRHLAQGTLAPELDPISSVFLCGVGHSGGGGVSVVQQGTFQSFDALSVLGMAADDVEIHGGHDGVLSEFEITEAGLLYRPTMAPTAWARGYLEDVPSDIVLGRRILPFPPSFPSVMKRGTLLAYAGAITCPVFVGMGEVDYVGSPFQEPHRYAQSPDVTVYVQPDSAHWHFMGSRRHEFWTAHYNWLWSRARFRDGQRPDTAPRGTPER